MRTLNRRAMVTGSVGMCLWWLFFPSTGDDELSRAREAFETAKREALVHAEKLHRMGAFDGLSISYHSLVRLIREAEMDAGESLARSTDDWVRLGAAREGTQIGGSDYPRSILVDRM